MHAHTRYFLIAFVWLAAAPAIAYAQASITGVVRDTSGAVLPGVMVEASSPVLIEKVRSVLTDGAGQYRIIDLRPGTYTVTFTLPGFAIVQREGIELAGNFTATVNAELRLGALEETVTVTGETPVVDVQSAQRQLIVSRDVVAALPTGRSFQSIATLDPGIILNNQDVGGTQGPRSYRFRTYGTHNTDSRQMVDGLGVASADGGGASGSYYVINVTVSEEVVTTRAGGLGEAETAGVIVNVIPREGGNIFSGLGFATGASSGMQGDNYTQALKDQGLRAPNRLSRMWDLNSAFGGPIVRDRLWFYLSGRHAVADNFEAETFYRANHNDPNTWWTWEPDLSAPSIRDTKWWSMALRLTWQASRRNKVTAFWDEQFRCDGDCPGGPAVSRPESLAVTRAYPRVWQAGWTSPVSSRMLLEAGVGEHYLRWVTGEDGFRETPVQFANAKRVSISDQNPLIQSYKGAEVPGIPIIWGINAGRHSNHTYNWRSSLSYVTGTHNAKVGYRGSFYGYRKVDLPHLGVTYRFNNGVPNQITERYGSIVKAHLQSHGVYAQDQWSITPQLTLQGALRYDHWRSAFPARQVGPSFYVPEPFFIPATRGANLHDLSPRLAAAYDLMGDGRTALKFHVGKYMVGQESSNTGIFGSFMDPMRRIATSTTRSWTDGNGNFVPDCDLRNPAANGECGPMANRNFGTDVPAAVGGRDFSVNYDPDIVSGWRKRPYTWEFTASIQRELVPRVSTTLGYFRRWFGNFIITHNLATTAADYTLFDLPVPVDPRLPNSGGVVRGVATINSDKFGQVSEQVTAASKFGKKWIDRTQGIEVALDARLPNGLVVQGGVTTGSRLQDNCELAAPLPEVLGSQPLAFCRQEQPFQTQVKGLATYTIPRVDVQVSGTWQSIPGPEIGANWNVPTAVVQSVIGRPLAGGARNQRVGLISPQSLYGDRLNQIDFRAAKVLRVGGTRTLVGLDVFNALNTSVVTTYENTFGPGWLTPRGILEARLAKVSVQVDF